MTRHLLWALLIGLLLPASGVAHQRLVHAQPAAGAVLAAAPGALLLTFNQPVEPALARVRLVGPSGEAALAELEVPADAPEVIRARIVQSLIPGEYTVHWLVTSADGHPVRGEYRFSVETGSARLSGEAHAGVHPAAGTPTPEPVAPPGEPRSPAPPAARFDAESTPYVAVRWFTFVSLLVVIGSAGLALVVVPLLRRQQPRASTGVLDLVRTRAASVGLLGTGGLLLALLLRLYAQSLALQAPGAGLSLERTEALLVGTVWGWGWILQGVGTGVALVGLWSASRGRRVGWPLAGLAVLALAVTPALSGHAAAASMTAVVVDSLHVLAAGAWLGTLLLVVVVGLPMMVRHTDAKATAAASLIGAFSPLALASAVVLTATGVYSARLHLGDAATLWSSEYGRTLLLKLLLLSAVFATGAYSWLRAKPALEEGGELAPLRRSATVELVVGLAVVVVTAVLVATPPPAHSTSAATHAATTPGTP